MLGVGGSALGPELAIDALRPRNGRRFLLIDTVDPSGINRVLEEMNPNVQPCWLHPKVVALRKRCRCCVLSKQNTRTRGSVLRTTQSQSPAPAHRWKRWQKAGLIHSRMGMGWWKNKRHRRRWTPSDAFVRSRYRRLPTWCTRHGHVDPATISRQSCSEPRGGVGQSSSEQCGRDPILRSFTTSQSISSATIMESLEKARIEKANPHTPD